MPEETWKQPTAELRTFWADVIGPRAMTMAAEIRNPKSE
jgi:hypothetical protein